MIKSALLTVFFFNSILVLYAQDIIYIDQFCKKTSSSSAAYKRVIDKQKHSYVVKDYFLSGRLFMDATCSSANLQGKIVYDGKCNYYYEDGKKRIDGYFLNNHPLGIWKYFSEDGMDSITTKFDENDRQIVLESSYSNRLKKENKEKSLKNGSDSNSVSEKSNERSGKIIAIDAEFPGGKQALEQYIKGDFHYPKEALSRRISGIVKIYFEVDKTGELENIKPLSQSIGFGLEEEAMRIIKNMPTWVPASQNGKVGKQRRSIPFNYTLPN